MTKEQELKQSLLESLPSRLAPFEGLMRECDDRLWEYVEYVLDTKEDHANVYELCGLRHFTKMLECPDVDFVPKKVIKRISLLERLPSDTMRGRRTIRATKQQVYIFSILYGFYWWVNTNTAYDDQKLLPSEEVRDGIIWDYRRLNTDFDLYIPRKFGKTYIAGFDSLEGLLTSEDDYEEYLCANKLRQAKLLFNQTKDFVLSLSEQLGLRKWIRTTSEQINWIEGNPLGRKGLVEVMTAGGQGKDGMKAKRRKGDEIGSAPFIKDHSDMANLVAVIDSSMGTRREPHRMYTTTAGRINSGPYMLRLEILQQQLMNDTLPLTTFAYLLQPDPWEITDEELLLTSPTIWRKVNPHLGITIQNDFYEKEIAKARLDPDYMKEVLTKLFNIFQTDKAIDWIKAEDVRKLQTDRTIDDCTAEEGWIVFVGLDFSMGNDLHAISYLAVRENDEGTGMEFFGDMDAWISEEAYNEATLQDLYKVWIERGHLKLSPGATLDPNLPVNRIAQLYDNGVTFGGFGYDTYKAKTPINALSAWLVEITGNNKAPKDYIVPVSQTYAAYNPVVEEMDYMVKSEPALITFSSNPMLPWEFSNCILDVDVRYGNKKPLKRSANLKVDNVQCLLSALMMYDRAEGREQK